MPIDQWINAGTLMGVEFADAESWGATDNDFMAGLRNSLDCRDFLVDVPNGIRGYVADRLMSPVRIRAIW